MGRQLAAIASLSLLLGCTAVGTGDRTVIRAETADQGLASRFPFYLVHNPTDADRALIIDSHERSVFPAASAERRASQFERFKAYMDAKYGSSAFKSAELSLTVRDLGRLPPLAPDVVTLLRQEMLKALSDASLKEEERAAHIAALGPCAQPL